MNESQLHLVRRTTWVSIAVQLATGVLLLSALLSDRGPPFLRSLLALEAAVQAVELAFYLYIVRTLTTHASVRSMAANRYADWFFTTPVMLVTLAGFFRYEAASDKGAITLGSFLRDNRDRLLGLVGANVLMLISGVLGEVGAIPVPAATAAGFLGYAAAFWQLYGFVDSDRPVSRLLFWAVAAVWAVYGVAYLFPAPAKNATYNYLDLVAKNFFGAFLSVRVLLDG